MALRYFTKDSKVLSILELSLDFTKKHLPTLKQVDMYPYKTLMFHSHQGQTPDLRAHPQGHGGPRGGSPSTDPPAPTGQRPVRDAPRVSTVRLTSLSLFLSYIPLTSKCLILASLGTWRRTPPVG